MCKTKITYQIFIRCVVYVSIFRRIRRPMKWREMWWMFNETLKIYSLRLLTFLVDFFFLKSPIYCTAKPYILIFWRKLTCALFLLLGVLKSKSSSLILAAGGSKRYALFSFLVERTALVSSSSLLASSTPFGNSGLINPGPVYDFPKHKITLCSSNDYLGNRF